MLCWICGIQPGNNIGLNVDVQLLTTRCALTRVTVTLSCFVSTRIKKLYFSELINKSILIYRFNLKVDNYLSLTIFSL